MKRIAYLSSALVLTLITACRSAPPVIEEGIPPALFFQRAQDEADNYRWDNALLYYETFLARFPDDLPGGLAARYEIAFIHYKMDAYEESLALFKDLQDRYNSLENPRAVPQWPKVLADKLVPRIEEIIRNRGAAGRPSSVPALPPGPPGT